MNKAPTLPMLGTAGNVKIVKITEEPRLGELGTVYRKVLDRQNVVKHWSEGERSP